MRVRGSCPSPVERGFVVCDMGKKAFFSVYGTQVDVAKIGLPLLVFIQCVDVPHMLHQDSGSLHVPV
jgi:hypothetical protein